MSDQAPTPGQVLDMLVKRYVPVTSPRTTNPDPIGHAKRQLTSAMLIEAYGQDHPLACIVQAYAQYARARHLDPLLYLETVEKQERFFKALQALIITGEPT